MDINTEMVVGLDGSTAQVNPVLGDAIDMVLVLSSELVCHIAEKYFNQAMLKKKVKVIDLQPTANGLVQFTVAFVVSAKPVDVSTSDMATGASVKLGTMTRDRNGKFSRKGHEHGQS